MQEDIRAGYVAAILYNVNRKKNEAAKEVGDFFPSVPRRKKTLADYHRMAEVLALRYGGGSSGDERDDTDLYLAWLQGG